MAKINIDHELNHVSGILSDVETLDLPWSDLELAGFDWFMAVWAVRELHECYDEMNELQKKQFESLRDRMTAVKDKLTALDLKNPFEQE